MGKGKRLLGVLIIILSIAALFVWEKWGKNEFLYEEILVASKDIPAGVTITENMFTTARIETGEKDSLKKEEINKLVGLQSASFIHKNVPLFKEYFIEGFQVPNKDRNEYRLMLPVHWIDSLPNTIKKGDDVYVYGNNKVVAKSKIAYISDDNKAIEIITGDSEIKGIMSVIEKGNKLVITCN